MKIQMTTLMVCLVSILCGPASAQWKDNRGVAWNNPTSASIGNIINDQLWNRMRAKARARANGNAAAEKAVVSEASKSLSPQIEAALRFRSTGTELRTQAIADELSTNGTPESKNQMLTL